MDFIFLYTSFGFEIYLTCYQHRDDLVAKFSLHINKNSILEGVLKLEVLISFPLCFSQEHMLVDLVYIFLCGSFGFEIFDTLINVMMTSYPKFHGQIMVFESLGGCQSGQL